MRRIIANALAVALLAGLLVVPAIAAALPAPPADGQKVDLGPDFWDAVFYTPYDYPVGSGTWYADGTLFNWSSQIYAGGVTVLDPHTTAQYWNAAGDTVVGRETFSVGIGTMPACPADAGYYFFHHQLTVPAGANPSLTTVAPEVPPSVLLYPKYHYGTAASTAVSPTSLYHNWGAIDATTLGAGRTRMKLTVRNDTANVVGPLVVSGAEKYQIGLVEYPLDTFEIVALEPEKAARLAPGDSTTFSARGLRATPAGATRLTPFSWVTVAPPLADTTIWRFRNKEKGTYFYTASESERNAVSAGMSATYQLEGPSYTIHSASSANNTPLYRFYNRKTGTHFYTANETERNSVATLGTATFTFEGIAYYVSAAAPLGSRPVWRFANTKTGTYFYTASSVEKTNVETTAASTYHLEGVAFNLAP